MAAEQPNVLVILADDIGWFDIGALNAAAAGLGNK
jgi:arylsulfatase A-like enzyme